ncbi:hypothetical protein BCR42DRAFT_487593 [Absidia repens]|uniref:BED-type domain-containing protein n=1 Tax=Absidia repens TaxID=90262 RepID=A0A1X2IXB9_9FUNG|nr:hypothetical protein BCR42DRAFT_487593 [Absidia repens]
MYPAAFNSFTPMLSQEDLDHGGLDFNMEPITSPSGSQSESQSVTQLTTESPFPFSLQPVTQSSTQSSTQLPPQLLTQSPKNRQRSSPVWTYFALYEDGNTASCMLCMENNRLFTVKCTNKSTSGQWKHLKAKHYEIYRTIKDVDDKAQPTIDEIFQRQFAFDSDKFNVLLAEWLLSQQLSRYNHKSSTITTTIGQT